MTEDTGENGDNEGTSGTRAKREALPLVCKALGWGFNAAQVGGRKDGH